MCAEVDEGEALVLVGYASTMEAVQRFELALKHLVITKTEFPENISYEAAWTRALSILRSPAGRLESEVPNDLFQRVRDLRELRNRLAHDVLLRWRLETSVGLETHEEVADALIEIEQEFLKAGAAISKLADANMRLQGIDPDAVQMSPGELRRILRER